MPPVEAIAAHKDLETLQLATTQSEAELDERDARRRLDMHVMPI